MHRDRSRRSRAINNSSVTMTRTWLIESTPTLKRFTVHRRNTPSSRSSGRISPWWSIRKGWSHSIWRTNRSLRKMLSNLIMWYNHRWTSTIIRSFFRENKRDSQWWVGRNRRLNTLVRWSKSRWAWDSSRSCIMRPLECRWTLNRKCIITLVVWPMRRRGWINLIYRITKDKWQGM